MKILYIILTLFYSNLSLAGVFDELDLISIYDIESSNSYARQFYFDGKDLFYAFEDSGAVKVVDLSNNKMFNLILPENIKNHGIYTFSVSSDSLFYNDWQHFHCFKKINDKYVHQFSTALHDAYYNMKPIGDKIFLYDVRYSSSSIKSGYAANIEVIDIDKQNQFTEIFPDPSGSGFSFFVPNKVMEVANNSIIISDYDNYNINFYDLKSNLIDKIHYIPKEWVHSDQKIPKYPKNFYKPSIFIQNIQPLTAKTSLIHNISLINDNKLFVCWSIPNGIEFVYKYRYDIWERRKGKWELTNQNLADFGEDENEIIKNSTIPIMNNFRIINDFIIVVNRGCAKELLDKNLNKPYSKLKIDTEDYFIENDLKTLIGVYRFK